ncbi:MAG: hypothetical protein WA303_08415 [Bradyrhizobium sp.]
MPGCDRPETTPDDGIPMEAKPGCVALVPVVQAAQWSQIPGRELPRPNSTFLTHLIATAEHVPQTCSLRRATPHDAQIAYNANQHWVHRTPIRTRQVM